MCDIKSRILKNQNLVNLSNLSLISLISFVPHMPLKGKYFHWLMYNKEIYNFFSDKDVECLQGVNVLKIRSVSTLHFLVWVFITLYLFYVYVCVSVRVRLHVYDCAHECATVQKWGSEEIFLELVHAFHHVGPGNQTELSGLANPEPFLSPLHYIWFIANKIHVSTKCMFSGCSLLLFLGYKNVGFFWDDSLFIQV